MREILGLMSYFGRFIRNYSQEAKPLTDLIQANSQKITWSIKAQDSLDYQKKHLFQNLSDHYQISKQENSLLHRMPQPRELGQSNPK